MKKTLIALAVTASAVISGSAMAWEANGTGGSVNIGGNLTPAENITPWEVKTGAAVTGLDADINKGQSVVNISVESAIPVLGIRVANATTKAFMGGQPGIVPQIDYHGVIDTDAFENGAVPMSLDIKDAQDQKIGKMNVKMIAYGESAWENTSNNQGPGKKVLWSDQAGKAFFGGLGKNNSAVNELYNRIVALDSEFSANYIDFGATAHAATGTEDFTASVNYSAFYGSGIEQGNVIKLTLDSPAQGDAPITWKASLPITVSYQ